MSNLNNYTLLGDFRMAGSGQCEWTFAQKDGVEYFIKRFLKPKYPVAGSPGSEKTKRLKLEQCKRFEDHHSNIKKVLEGKSSTGGNLIVTRDFFRLDTMYYKVTDKVDIASISIERIAKLPIEKKLVIMKTVAHSLKMLHDVNIVHGDLKPDNILIKETETGSFTTKLIDFDDSFFSEKPPESTDELVGDLVYYSPELGHYIEDRESSSPSDLQLKSDIFALSLIYHQYLTGNLPKYDTKEYKYPYSAVLNDGELIIEKTLPPKIIQLLTEMMDKDLKKRPSIAEAFSRLKEADITDKSVKTPEPPKEKSVTPTGGKLRIRMGGGKSSETPPAETDKHGAVDTKAEKTESKLKGTLIKKK